MTDATPLDDYIASRAFQYAGALEYVEDFMRAWNATQRDPEGRAALTIAYQQAQAYGQDHGGLSCCGTTSDWHRPWCRTGPRRYRTPAPMADDITSLRRALAEKDAEIARLTAELDSMRDVPVEYVTEAGLESAMAADPHREDGAILRETNGARRAFEWNAKTGEWALIT